MATAIAEAAVEAAFVAALDNLPATLADVSSHPELATITQYFLANTDFFAEGAKLSPDAQAILSKVSTPALKAAILDAVAKKLPGLVWAYLKLVKASWDLYSFDRFGWILQRITNIRHTIAAANSLDATAKLDQQLEEASGGLSIASGVLAILGLALAPFTAGASVVLTGLSLGTGIASAATGIAGDANDTSKLNQALKDLNAGLQVNSRVLVYACRCAAQRGRCTVCSLLAFCCSAGGLLSCFGAGFEPARCFSLQAETVS